MHTCVARSITYFSWAAWVGVSSYAAIGDGTWSPSQGEGLHHIGYGHPDVPGQCELFGGEADTLVAGDGGRPRVIFTRPAALHGVRVEYLESTMVAATMARLREMTGGQ